jgi:hypothetical protein
LPLRAGVHPGLRPEYAVAGAQSGLALAQAGLGGLHAGVAGQSLLHHGIQLRRVKQLPPIAGLAAGVDETLRCAVRGSSAGRIGWGRVAADLGRLRTGKIRADGAAASQREQGRDRAPAQAAHGACSVRVPIYTSTNWPG